MEKNPNQSNNEKEETPNLDRRKFLKNALTAGGVVASGLILGKYMADNIEKNKRENPPVSMDGVITKVEHIKEQGIMQSLTLNGMITGTITDKYFIYIKGINEIKISVKKDVFDMYKMGDSVNVLYQPHTNRDIEVIDLKKR